ncbi:translation initiation factor 1 [Strigomonas culicis]|uniref:Translation initiation factor 1 n=1 Tax=Strigomonas culicis TaxID=28005 RepID=S9UI19_9TRYP|nr:translation initiation factor 1 [Strigomonas culicis]EPY30146.1 translation initiation factor 1 [Strigomonas culicis]|eukprot:EPY28563.1 translation initiation factor 1 [Strigomonas culicis]
MDAENMIVDQQRAAEREVLEASRVHIHVKQRNRKKCVTTLQGIDPKLNFDLICRHFQQKWGCNGSVIDGGASGKVIQLQGNWSEKMQEFVLKEHMATENNLEVHSL